MRFTTSPRPPRRAPADARAEGANHDGRRTKWQFDMAMTRRLLNIQEASEYTGLSVHTLYTMVSQRRIPFIKMGRLTKFDVGLLDKWIAQHTVMPVRKEAEKAS